jgi:hypothetical protein
MRQILVQVTCDLGGELVPEGEVTVVTWSWQGKSLEFEVCPEHTDVTGNTVGYLLEVSRPLDPSRPTFTPTRQKPGPKPGTRRGQYTKRHGGYESTGPNGQRVIRYSTEDYAQYFGNTQGTFDCPLCTTTGLASNVSLRGHVWNVHDRRLWEVLSERLAKTGKAAKS